MFPLFPAQLRALRTAKGYSQLDLAALTGLGRQSIIRYENGQGSPNTKALQSLASVLGVSVSDLLGEANDLEKALELLGQAVDDSVHGNDFSKYWLPEARALIAKYQETLKD